MILKQLDEALSRGWVRPFDVQFAHFIQRLNKGPEEVALGAFLVSRQANEGDACIELSRYAETSLIDVAATDHTLVGPELDHWTQCLSASRAVGQPGEQTPLILDQGRLYLGRYWHYEADLARALVQRSRQLIDLPGADLLTMLERYFPSQEQETDWQRIATIIALRHRFSVISGGPGTGKTTTIAKLLILLITLASEPLRIGLAAPTGKAAARLTESLRILDEGLDCEPEIRARIPATAMTIHRLLGYRPAVFNFRYHRRNPLHLDLLVIDEASMVDLPLMASVVDALPAECRLILLGDKDQLSSVEAGSVLGDICKYTDTTGYSREQVTCLQRLHGSPLDIPGGSVPPIQDCIAVLRKSYRFSESSGIGQLANAVNSGLADRVQQLLVSTDYHSIRWIEQQDEQLTYLEENALPYFTTALSAGDPQQALAGLERYGLLTALREGPVGVGALNEIIEQLLAAHGLRGTNAVWYVGRPIMITQNDYSQGLFNGDIGVVHADPAATGRLRVFFKTSDGGLRSILPQRLPPHETAYAMTIHKSQGSEFDHLCLILPGHDSPLLTRELFYTGITRARHKLDLLASGASLVKATERRTQRSSGLGDILWASAELDSEYSGTRPQFREDQKT